MNLLKAGLRTPLHASQNQIHSSSAESLSTTSLIFSIFDKMFHSLSSLRKLPWTPAMAQALFFLSLTTLQRLLSQSSLETLHFSSLSPTPPSTPDQPFYTKNFMNLWNSILGQVHKICYTVNTIAYICEFDSFCNSNFLGGQRTRHFSVFVLNFLHYGVFFRFIWFQRSSKYCPEMSFCSFLLLTIHKISHSNIHKWTWRLHTP